jgi:spermidine synthase
LYVSNIINVYDLIPSPSRIAVIGLGAGVISVYLNEKDIITYYEIDPDNYGITKEWFTYLDNCKVKLKVVIGDGRLSIKNSEKDGYRYDLITVDGFSGDGIPMHLLTKEAIEDYLKRLNENGLILFHISKRYYDLRPVIKSVSSLNRLTAFTFIRYTPRIKNRLFSCIPNLNAQL